jgi:nicotinate-nucleotide adenylyltransferase
LTNYKKNAKLCRQVKKIGLFGGTFNPIHLGHATLAQNVFIDFQLDELVFMPSNIPPHKTIPFTTAKDRYEMTLLTAKALTGNFSVSDFELNSKGLSYTYITLLEWRKRYPEDIIYFICGSDIFATITTWQNWKELFSLSKFIVANRKVPFAKLYPLIPKEIHNKITFQTDLTNSKTDCIIFYEMDSVRTSSTKIRGRLAAERCKDELPEDVYRYIIEHNLYLTGG